MKTSPLHVMATISVIRHSVPESVDGVMLQVISIAT